MTLMIPGQQADPYYPTEGAPWEPTRDPFTRRLPVMGQLNPRTKERLLMQTGRHLAGLNEIEEPYDPNYQEHGIKQLEDQDDVYGSGIFDTYGRKGNLHTNLGVFAESMSLPGFISREVQFAVSRDIADLTDNADVVIVPAGGMAVPEQRGRPVYWQRLGPKPPSPGLEPAHVPTTKEEIYVSIQPQYLHAPRPTPMQRPVRTEATIPLPLGPIRPVHFRPVLPDRTLSPVPLVPTVNPGVVPTRAGGPSPFRPVPMNHPQNRIATRDISRATAGQAVPLPPVLATPGGRPVTTNAMVPVRGSAPVRQAARAAGPVSIPSSTSITTPLRGFGADDEDSYGKYLVAGLLVGGGLAVLVASMGKKRRK